MRNLLCRIGLHRWGGWSEGRWYVYRCYSVEDWIKVKRCVRCGVRAVEE